MKEFTIESKKTHKFRIAKISPVELLALQMQIDFSNLQLTVTLFSYILEHIEVEISKQWVPVKEKNRDVYMPVDLENDFLSLRELVFYFLNSYMKPLFTNSNELK